MGTLNGVQITWQGGSSTDTVLLYGRETPRYDGQMPIRNSGIEAVAARIGEEKSLRQQDSYTVFPRFLLVSRNTESLCCLWGEGF